MKITILVENSVCESSGLDLKPEHGLSVHIEVDNTNILFDVGKSDLFIHNSKKLGVDLSKVDYLIISHGHFDHGGGLKYFLEINKKAKIFMHRGAENKHFTKILGFLPYNIGLDKHTINKYVDRIVFIDKEISITDRIALIDNFPDDFPRPKGNLSLYEKCGGKSVHDKFEHEIALLISEDDKSVLFTACSHSGIINMYKRVKAAKNGVKIDCVFGGFHTYNPVSKKNESKTYLDMLTSELKKTNSIYYTGHCTGKSNFNYMKKKLADKIYSMNTGDVIEI